MKDKSLRRKLIMTFAGLIVIVSICIAFFSVFIFNKIYNEKSNQFILDIESQTTNNLEENISSMEEMTFELLKNSIIQEQLSIVNRITMSDYRFTILRKKIENELGAHALFNDKIVSLSVISLNKKEFTVQPLVGNRIKQMFTPEEIISAKGSTIWSITDDGENNICIARAIISLKTQKPIGYINVIVSESYFGDIIQDITGTYTSGAYVIDENSIVISSNNKDMLNKIFPINGIDFEKDKYVEAVIQEIPSYVYKGKRMDNDWNLVVTVPIHEVTKDAMMFIMIVCLIAMNAVILSVLYVFTLIKRLLEPLESLKESMKSVGYGDFSSRVENNTDDEIGELSRSYNHMADNIETLIEKVYKMEIAQHQAEIEFLKMQINPHFLYNTLDTISWMSRMQHNDDVAEVAIVLADLLRSNIKQESMITVGQELKNVRNYIFIQEYRFGDKISVEYEIDSNVRNYRIPNFILQPLVENAIIHGLEPQLEKGTLKISILLENEKVNFCISDDGIGMSANQIEDIYEQCESDDSNQFIGIKNVYRRLKISYGEKETLKIESEIEKGTRISFSIAIDKLKKVYY